MHQDDGHDCEQHVPDGGDDWGRLSDHLPVLVEFEA